MYILGINAIFHESAACLIKDGQLIAAVEEERYNRIKHGKEARIDNTDELPLQSIKHCLDAAAITLADVDHIGYSALPKKFRQSARDLPHDELLEFFAALERIPKNLAALGWKGELTWVEHHLAHAASAYFLSPFADAAVLAIDGLGEADTALLCHGQGNRLHRLRAVPYPDSLGFLWEVCSLFLGFDVYDAAKVMGLAAYGNPQRFAAQFRQLVELLADGTFKVHADLLRFNELRYYPPTAYLSGLEALFGLKPRLPESELGPSYQDIAAALQHTTNRVLLHMAEKLHAKTGSENLCIAGGVALNCVANSVAFEKGPFRHLYVQPASHDAGTAIGAAYFIWHQILGRPERDVMQHAYWGPAFSNEQIEERLRAHGLRYRRSDHLELEVAKLISEGNIVGFFQGRMELGPRALGNRSLLADPRNSNMREILNHKVKHREYFRPLAPSVLAEAASEWFAIGKETLTNDFMLMTYPARAHLRDRIPAVLHVDGSSRIQTVRSATNPRYHRLISEFLALTGVPIVLNTSFNDSEPIVCSPDDAIHTFQKTQIDYLAIGDFIVTRAENAS